MTTTSKNLTNTKDIANISKDLALEYYNMASMVSMTVETIPEEMDSVVLGKLYPLYEKVKEKDKDLARFLMGMLYCFKDESSVGVTLTIMAYLGLESVHDKEKVNGK